MGHDVREERSEPIRRSTAPRREAVLRPIASVPGTAIPSTPDRIARVSVVIPNFNYARFLPQAIGSALAQEHVDVEVVVVDDASTDASVEVLDQLADRDSRIQVVVNPHNRGAVETFNTGLHRAEGEYVVRLDADDLLTPGSLARAMSLGERFPSVGLVYGRPVHFHGSPRPPRPHRARGWTVWNGDDWLERRCRLGVNCITSPEAVMRMSTIRAAGGGQRPELAHAHDMEMWFRLARFGDVGHVDGVDQALHREHGESLSAREVDVLGDMRHREQVFAILLEDGSPRAEELHDLARRALADEALTRVAQAYAAGRGGTAETEEYLTFARGQGVPLDQLPAAALVEHAHRLGPRRARLSPVLLMSALRVRDRARRAVARTIRTGV